MKNQRNPIEIDPPRVRQAFASIKNDPLIKRVAIGVGRPLGEPFGIEPTNIVLSKQPLGENAEEVRQKISRLLDSMGFGDVKVIFS